MVWLVIDLSIVGFLMVFNLMAKSITISAVIILGLIYALFNLPDYENAVDYVLMGMCFLMILFQIFWMARKAESY